MRDIVVVGLLWMGCGRSVGEVTVCGAPRGPQLQPLTSSEAQRAFAARHPWPMLQQQGGQVQQRARLVAVFFGDDPLREPTEALLQSYGCTRWWREAVAEYGVGDYVYARTIVVNEPFPTPVDPASDGEFSGWVLDHQKLFAPAPDEVLVFFAPEGAYDRCPRSLGWHSEALLGVHKLPFALIKDCPPGKTTSTSAMDQRSRTTTHELLEIALNPFPQSAPAWRDLSTGWWPATDYTENADLCDSIPIVTREYPFAMVSSWSNRRAALGLLPCSSNEQPFVVALARESEIDLTTGSATMTVDVYADLPNEEVSLSISAGCAVAEPNSVVAHGGDTFSIALTTAPDPGCQSWAYKPTTLSLFTSPSGAEQLGLVSEVSMKF